MCPGHAIGVPVTESCVPVTRLCVPVTEFCVPVTQFCVPVTRFGVLVTRFRVPVTRFLRTCMTYENTGRFWNFCAEFPLSILCGTEIIDYAVKVV